jgi:hypothetical protein
MAAIWILVHALLRGGALAVLLVGYDAVYDQLVTPTPGDADIGKGLLAFLVVAAVSLAWGLVDGLRTDPVVWAVAWVLAGLGVALGWELLVTDGSLADVEVGSLVFLAQLVLVPALVGAGIGWASGGRHRRATA